MKKEGGIRCLAIGNTNISHRSTRIFPPKSILPPATGPVGNAAFWFGFFPPLISSSYSILRCCREIFLTLKTIGSSIWSAFSAFWGWVPLQHICPSIYMPLSFAINRSNPGCGPSFLWRIGTCCVCPLYYLRFLADNFYYLSGARFVPVIAVRLIIGNCLPDHFVGVCFPQISARRDQPLVQVFAHGRRPLFVGAAPHRAVTRRVFFPKTINTALVITAGAML